MILIGHLGITLFLCAPLAHVLVASGHRTEVPRWVGIALVVTLLPDFDFILPWFTHRGVTHSLLAAGCFGVVAAVAGSKWDTTPISPDNRVRQAKIGFAVGAGSTVGHLVGDLITPMGIRPFFPFDSVYTLDLVYAKDMGANLAFVVVGVVVFWTVYRRSKDPMSTDGAASSAPTADSDVRSINP